MEQAAASPFAQDKPVSGRSKGRDWIEIAVAYGFIIAVEWAPRPLQGALLIVATAGIILITCISFDGVKAMGLRGTNFWRSLWIAGAALALAAAAVFVAARKHTLLVHNGPLAFIAAYCIYAVWAAVQQFLLQDFFLLRFLRVIPNERLAALAASLLFALAHLPNPVLTPITLIWGFAACLLFLRYRNLYPLMIAHAILGITVAMTVPGPVVHNMRVGLGYLTYSPHRHPHRAHWLTQP